MRIDLSAPETLARSVGLFKALADPVRLRLLSLLAGGEVCVCHLHEALELPQPTVSRHLAYLRKSGLVAGRKHGLWVYYRLAKPTGELHRRLMTCIRHSERAIDLLKHDRQRLEARKCCRGEVCER
jgi:ArsR family transcriptional regulator